MKRILFCNMPSYVLANRFGLDVAASQRYEPLGLLYVMSYCGARGLQFTFADLEGAVASEGDPLSSAVQKHEPDILLLPIHTVHQAEVLGILKALRTQRPHMLVVAGGVNATNALKYMLASGAVDFVVRGEGEVTTYELLASLTSGHEPDEVLGISYVRNGTIVHNDSRARIADLSNLPLDRSLLGSHYYTQSTNRLHIQTMRGCPYSCSFCESPTFWNKKVTLRTPESIAREIEAFVTLVKHELPRNFVIHVVDDIFTLGPPGRIEAVSRAIGRFGIPWTVNSKANVIRHDVLVSLSSNGCRKIKFGLESGAPAVLARMNKGQTIPEMRQAVAAAAEHGLLTQASFIVGFPGETEEDVAETIAFACSVPLDIAYFFICTPYPGTELFERYVVNQEAIDFSSYALFNTAQIRYSLPTTTGVDLLEQWWRCYHAFYAQHKGIALPDSYWELSLHARVGALVHRASALYAERGVSSSITTFLGREEHE